MRFTQPAGPVVGAGGGGTVAPGLDAVAVPGVVPVAVVALADGTAEDAVGPP
ncbi:hypothetical protein [Actinacidiphila acididurans]|uniref:Uncharacterized protein n=1 Tax=Actinacidiphila acididurans TaxID=2784346 RepID=A0ABS2U627_9ACTN|nr:hypothetical protein [Actinacidiphila acididurans]MBM9510191.1 hypothetical protein [Actinacidiphila acididurans]